MALLNFAGDRAQPQSYRHKGRGTVQGRLSSWQRAILEFIGTLLVLMGISVGILTLRFALVLMHQVTLRSSVRVSIACPAPLEATLKSRSSVAASEIKAPPYGTEGATAALQAPSTEVSASATRTGKRQLDTAILRAALR
jgi:hypothetical protein